MNCSIQRNLWGGSRSGSIRGIGASSAKPPAVANDGERRWKLGGRLTHANRHDCSFVKDLSEVEVNELVAKFGVIHELAEQRGMTRVLESGNRWGARLDAVRDELELDGAISAQSQKAAQLELRAFTRLCKRFIDELAEETTDLPPGSDTSQDPSLFDRLEQIRRTGPYALLVEASGAGKLENDSLLQLRKTPDPLYVRGFEVYGARELVARTVGDLVGLLISCFLLREPSYRPLAAEIRQLSRQVPEGMPSIFSFVETDGDERPSSYEMTDLPVFALVGLDHAFSGVNHRPGPDPILELLRGRYRRQLRFGKASADSAAIGGNSSGGFDMLPTATVQLDIDLLGSEPIDYWAPMSDSVEEGGLGRDMFLGAVQRATPDGRLVALECEGATALTEEGPGGTLAANMDGAEVIRELIALSSWDGDLELSKEEKAHPPEVFDVFVPLHGVTVEEAVRIGSVLIVSRERGLREIAPLGQDETGETGAEMLAEFGEAASFALARPTAQRINEAEDRGLGEIDIAIAWMTTRGRYGATTLPDGTVQPFDRQQALRAPHRGPVVFVCGTSTRRLWLRRPAGPSRAIERYLSSTDSAIRPALPVELPVNDRLALLALRLAASEIDPLMQVRALWQAVESYAEKRKGEQKLFNRRDRKAIKKAIFDSEDLSLSKRQRERLTDAIKGLNHESLMLRLRRRLKEDAVLVTEDELALLSDLYEIRHDVVHGRLVEEPPHRDQINYGISIVSRMLVHRIASLEADAVAGSDAADA